MAFAMIGELRDSHETRYGLRFSGVSEAAKEGKYHNLGMDYDTHRCLNKDEGRRLILTVMDEFLNKINSTESFHQHMTVHPFDSYNIVISIFVDEKKGQPNFFPDLDIISIYNGKIRYKFYLQELGSNLEDEQVEIETIEEARRIVASQDTERNRS